MMTCVQFRVSSTLLAAVVAATAGMTQLHAGQAAKATSAPLVLKEQGSFYVGGEIIHTDAASGTPGGPSFFGGTNEGNIAVNHMYVEYQIPKNEKHPPIVLIHGGDLSGSGYETTPDGRMGWEDYFVRNGYPTYVPDQVGRARSGFDPTKLNKVRLGELPGSEAPNVLVIPQQVAWSLWRFGPTFGTPYADTQFPVEFVDELQKSQLPDFNSDLPSPNPTLGNLAKLGARLDGAILVGHSQSMMYPVQAALTDPEAVKGIIAMEGFCSTLTDEELAVLRDIPVLVVFGDHIDDPSVLNWPALFESCVTFVQQLEAVGGNVTFLHLPEVGVFGNSHMMMIDKNNLEVADLLMAWIEENVAARRKL